MPISFDDERTKIATVESTSVRVGTGRAHLLRCSFRSDQLGERTVAILRARTTNRRFLDLATQQRWTPETFIGICDGCGGFGGNRRIVDGREVAHCENNFDPDDSLPLKLKANWWVTDHFAQPAPKVDPTDGSTIDATSGGYPVRLTQVAFLSTKWRSMVSDERRLHGGARIFAIEQGLAASSDQSGGADE